MVKKKLTVGRKTFILDDLGCLMHFSDWQPEFAEGMAEEAGITPPLTETHKKFIAYLRETVVKSGRTPIVHRACRDNGFKLWELETLFPAGYHRGACKLAGLNYYDRHTTREPQDDKVYRINARGFLVDAAEWDESFAAMRAEELGMTLNERHWQIIRFLRDTYQTTGKVPTVYEACRAGGLDVGALELLFPQGYQRGAVKIAGLALAV